MMEEVRYPLKTLRELKIVPPPRPANASWRVASATSATRGRMTFTDALAISVGGPVGSGNRAYQHQTGPNIHTQSGIKHRCVDGGLGK